MRPHLRYHGRVVRQRSAKPCTAVRLCLVPPPPPRQFVLEVFYWYSFNIILNYLAHIFLSSSPQEQVGNFIGDFVKGNRFEAYPHGVQKGILLHRAIDDFTDKHPVVREAKGLLRVPFGRYAAIVLDMYFDHFLGAHFADYSPVSLKTFSRKFYWALWWNRRVLPAQVRGFMWHFILGNRLCKYASPEGLCSSLALMAQYKPFPVEAGEAIAFLQAHYEWLYRHFAPFFPEVIAFAKGNRGS